MKKNILQNKNFVADYYKSMSSQLEIQLLALKALDIAKEELSKYLPDDYVADTSNKVLNKVNPDQDNLG